MPRAYRRRLLRHQVGGRGCLGDLGAPRHLGNRAKSAFSAGPRNRGACKLRIDWEDPRTVHRRHCPINSLQNLPLVAELQRFKGSGDAG